MDADSNFFSALAGAVVGGLASFVATWLQHCLENKRNESDSKKTINATLKAIKAELIGLQERYMETIGSELESVGDDSPFLFFYYAHEDYFTIYNQNASVLGQIGCDQLRASIVSVYIQIKSLLDTYKSNNALIEKYDYYSELYLETKSPKHQEQKHIYYELLLHYLPYIKDSHKKTMNLGLDIINNITKYLSSSEK